MTRVRLIAFPFRKFPLPELLLMPKNPRVTFQGLLWFIGALKKKSFIKIQLTCYTIYPLKIHS